ncbi:unnamed protein product [Chrysoparadoxa australica]
MVKVAINGFGRIGRILFRFLWCQEGVEVVHVNEVIGGAETAAYLLQFDSIHGTWDKEVVALEDGSGFTVEGKLVTFSGEEEIASISWSELNVDLACCCTGKFLAKAKLQAYFDGGVKRVVVSAPVKEEGVLNVVVGCNDGLLSKDDLICTAASCTTNCLAPMVKVMKESFGIKHGCITTIHNVTGTQPIIDMPMTKKKDLRRCRSGMLNLAPTSTGSATAIATIYPELKGKLNGLAIRVPMLNASITDAVFEVERETTVEEVNAALKAASENGPLKGIMGYETRPLVSTDYVNDERSGVVDANCTQVAASPLTQCHLSLTALWLHAPSHALIGLFSLSNRTSSTSLPSPFAFLACCRWPYPANECANMTLGVRVVPH